MSVKRIYWLPHEHNTEHIILACIANMLKPGTVIEMAIASLSETIVETWETKYE